MEDQFRLRHKPELLNYAETDWLASKPVFFNERTSKISYYINDVIDINDIEFDVEGLHNYLKYGYSIFGQTMIKDVKSLRYSSRIEKDEDGKLRITELPDPVEKLYARNISSGKEVIDLIVDKTRKWAESSDKRIVLPLSGGYDSKLLATALRGNNKVKAYSYGYSARQYESYEAVNAKMVAAECNIPWSSITLEDYMSDGYCESWLDLYGPAVHLHGMYQMEFYNKILCTDFQNSNARVLSGIIGDAWAGKVRISSIDSINDLIKLGYTHGLFIDDSVCKLPIETNATEKFWNDNREKLKEENWRIIFSMRNKIMLLSYLMKTPYEMQYEPWSPFLDIDIAMSIINLPWEEKTNRKWQREYFKKENVNYGWMKKKCDYNDAFTPRALCINPPGPLNAKVLERVIDPEYVESINNAMKEKLWKVIPAKPKTIQNMYNKVVYKHNANHIKMYNAYRILRPIEDLLLRIGN